MFLSCQPGCTRYSFDEGKADAKPVITRQDKHLYKLLLFLFIHILVSTFIFVLYVSYLYPSNLYSSIHQRALLSRKRSVSQLPATAAAQTSTLKTVMTLPTRPQHNNAGPVHTAAAQQAQTSATALSAHTGQPLIVRCLLIRVDPFADKQQHCGPSC
jgi:hypothetical protein